MRKQKLSPEASKAKAIRDKKIAMTGHRKKRKRENERMGQRSDSDIHHTKDGKQVRVSINKNRGNFGKGTKSEGPNMMGQTWLNRRIKGPNAEGDPVKKKKGGVKPYVTYDRDDPRIQAYSDSLDAHLLTNYFENEFMANRGYNLYNTFDATSANIVPANTPSLTTSRSWPYDYYASQTKVKPSRIISSNNKTVREFPLYDKPKQKVMLQSLEKMPIGKLKSKSTTPKQLGNRQTVMGTSGKREPAFEYQQRKKLSDEQMYQSFPGLKPK